MILEYFKMALASIRGSKFRSMLTMLGIIIGVSSVMIIVGLGEGVRGQVAQQVSEVSESLIVIRPGKQAPSRPFSLDNLRSNDSRTGSLSEQDWRDTEKVEGVQSVVPIGIVSGVASYDDVDYDSGTIIATTSPLPDLLEQPVEFGAFFTPEESRRQVAVIGRAVADDLFQEAAPVGKSLFVRGQRYIVVGVFAQQKQGTFAVLNVNNSIMLPYEAARELGGTIQLSQVYVEAEASRDVSSVAGNITERLIDNHAGQEDFTVLEREEALEATNETFYQLAVFTAGVAFISFIVGGIGIMNIMFATVSERTREIGIRKAIGATSQQILGQFIMESVVLSILGAMIGVAIALLSSVLIRVTTDLQPIITPRVIVLVSVIAIATGVTSGILPAAKAARKDPIESLRSQN